MIQRSLLMSCVLCLLGLRVVVGQTAYPMLMSIEPVASQIGATSEHTVKSRYSMEGASAILLSGTGVRGEIVSPDEQGKSDADAKPKSGESLSIRLHVDADAMPGVRDLRVVTPRGVSTVGQIALVADPVVYEQAGNDQPKTAQKVDIPATVCGRIEAAEDVDCFKFQVDAGTTLCFHVLCMRLQDRVHDLQRHADPIMTISDANGSVVAFSDNELQGDPLICHRFDRAGDYTLELRDVRFQGNGFWEYSVEINERPFVLTTFPLAVATPSVSTPTLESSLELIGFGLTRHTQVAVSLENALGGGLHCLPVKLNDSTVRPVNVYYSDQQILFESPNENDTAGGAQLISLPSTVNGRIEKTGDVDCFTFEAKQGERYSFEVIARRAGSALDAYLRILDAQGKQLQLSDDLRLGKRNSPDSWIENWTVPADGRYVLELRDLHLRGGEAFVYCLATTRSDPYFSLFADTDKTPIAPGTRGVVFVRAERKNGFDGEIALYVDGLPNGVRAHCGRILAGKGLDGCIVFEAENDLPPTAADIVIGGTSVVAGDATKQMPTSATALVYQEIYQPGGGRGHWPVESHVVAVTSPGDIREVAVSGTELTLRPGESKSIQVEIERAAGFDKNVILEVAYRHLNTVYGNSLPEGVTIDAAASSTLLTAGANTGKITFKAAENAPAVEKQQVVVMANVSLNFVMKATYASQPILISVAK